MGTITETGFKSSISIIFLFFLIILFLAVGLHCYVGFSLAISIRSYSLVVVSELLLVVASLFVAPRL